MIFRAWGHRGISSRASGHEILLRGSQLLLRLRPPVEDRAVAAGAEDVLVHARLAPLALRPQLPVPLLCVLFEVVDQQQYFASKSK